MFESYSIPVRIDVTATEAARGLIAIEGLLSYRAQELHLDYQTIDARMQRSDGQSVDIPLGALGELWYRKSLLGGRVMLRPLRLDTLDGVPGVREGELRLKVKRRHREQAAALASQVRLELSELRLAES